VGAVLNQDLGDATVASASISFISFIASTMQTTWPLRTVSPISTKAAVSRRRRAIKVPTNGDVIIIPGSAVPSLGGGGASDRAGTAGDDPSFRHLRGEAAPDAHVPRRIGLDLRQVELAGDARQLSKPRRG